MKSRAPLILMEQMVMLLVFALAAALCMQAFVKSDQMSQRSQDRDRALTQVQAVAETVRHCRGDMALAAELLELPYPYSPEEPTLWVHYDENWNCVGVGPGCGMDVAYSLAARPVDAGADGLGKARIEAVSAADETVIFALDVAWQEEVGGYAG